MSTRTEMPSVDDLKVEDVAPLVEDLPTTEKPPRIPDHKASKDRRPFWEKNGTPAPGKTPPASRSKKKPVSRAKQGAFIEPLTQMYGTVGTMVMLKDQPCGTAILTSAPACAEALDKLAYDNEAVRRVLDSLTSTTAIGMVLAAHAPIIMAVLMHHSPGAKAAMAQVAEAEDKATKPESESETVNPVANGSKKK